MKNRSKLLSVARHMPPLRHTIPGQAFDIRKSEVVQWLISKPEILNWLWNQIKTGEVVYNPETEKWQGIDYDD